MPTSVFIAGIIGFVIGATTNITGAILCGLFFALIMWSLTGFKINKKTSTSQNDHEPAPTSQKIAHSSSSNISPREFGIGLALSLDTSCSNSQISSTELSLLQQANISLDKYHQELIALCASAQEVAISAAIKNSDTRQSVLDGYREAWNNVRNSGPAGSALYQLFSQRRPTYSAAHFEDDKIRRDGNQGLVSSRLCLAFTDSIDSTADSPEKSGILFMLATISANACFSAHLVGTTDAIKRAGIT